MIIFNQKKYIEEILLKNGISINRINKDLFLLSKYYLAYGKLENEIFEILCDNVNKILPKGSIQDIIKYILKKATQLKSYSLNNEIMYVTKNELDTIFNFTEKIKEQKLIFSMLVIYKFMGCDYYNFVNTDIFKYAKVKNNNNEEVLDNLIHRMFIKGLISSYEDNIRRELLRKITFAETYQNSEIAITIENIDDNFIHHFHKYMGKKISNCEICETLIEKTQHNIKYCKDCKIKIRKETKLKTWHKNKNKYTRQANNPKNHDK